MMSFSAAWGSWHESLLSGGSRINKRGGHKIMDLLVGGGQK